MIFDITVNRFPAWSIQKVLLFPISVYYIDTTDTTVHRATDYFATIVLYETPVFSTP